MRRRPGLFLSPEIKSPFGRLRTKGLIESTLCTERYAAEKPPPKRVIDELNFVMGGAQ